MRPIQWLCCLCVATMFTFGCANAPESVTPATDPGHEAEAGGEGHSSEEMSTDLGEPAPEGGSEAPEASSDAAPEALGAPE